MILPIMFRGKIETLVKSEANKMLNAQFDFEKIDIAWSFDSTNTNIHLSLIRRQSKIDQQAYYCF